VVKLAKFWIHTYIIHTYVHTYIHTSIHTYIHIYMHSYIDTYIYTCMNAFIHTYIHTYIHPYIHTYIHTIAMSTPKYLVLSRYRFYIEIFGCEILATFCARFLTFSCMHRTGQQPVVFRWDPHIWKITIFENFDSIFSMEFVGLDF